MCQIYILFFYTKKTSEIGFEFDGCLMSMIIVLVFFGGGEEVELEKSS